MLCMRISARAVPPQSRSYTHIASAGGSVKGMGAGALPITKRRARQRRAVEGVANLVGTGFLSDSGLVRVRAYKPTKKTHLNLHIAA